MSRLEYRKVPTSAEVYAVIHATHRGDLKVYGTVSEPDGNPWGDPDDCRMVTDWMLTGGEGPFIGAESRWTKGENHKSDNEQHTYWLWLPVEPEDA